MTQDVGIFIPFLQCFHRIDGFHHCREIGQIVYRLKQYFTQHK